MDSAPRRGGTWSEPRRLGSRWHPGPRDPVAPLLGVPSFEGPVTPATTCIPVNHKTAPGPQPRATPDRAPLGRRRSRVPGRRGRLCWKLGERRDEAVPAAGSPCSRQKGRRRHFHTMFPSNSEGGHAPSARRPPAPAVCIRKGLCQPPRRCWLRGGGKGICTSWETRPSCPTRSWLTLREGLRGWGGPGGAPSALLPDGGQGSSPGHLGSWEAARSHTGLT